MLLLHSVLKSPNLTQKKIVDHLDQAITVLKSEMEYILSIHDYVLDQTIHIYWPGQNIHGYKAHTIINEDLCVCGSDKGVMPNVYKCLID